MGSGALEGAAEDVGSGALEGAVEGVAGSEAPGLAAVEGAGTDALEGAGSGALEGADGDARQASGETSCGVKNEKVEELGEGPEGSGKAFEEEGKLFTEAEELEEWTEPDALVELEVELEELLEEPECAMPSEPVDPELVEGAEEVDASS